MPKQELSYNDLKLPVYVNTRPVILNLDVSDLLIAATLSRTNLLLIGKPGTGKSQAAADIYTTFFGGNKAEKGKGVFIRAHPDIDIYNEIFTQLNIQKAMRELTTSIEALVYYVDEINRAPTLGQNQFFGLGDGIMDYNGKSIHLGKDGYRFMLATANLKDGEYKGTFEMEKALMNRLMIIDFDDQNYMPTDEDEMRIDRTRKPDPNVQSSDARDISDLIIQANKEIEVIATEPGDEATAVINFLRFGLRACYPDAKTRRIKDATWPLDCQDCGKNQKGKALCAQIDAPVRRTINTTLRYAAAMYYTAKLKNPNLKDIDGIDLTFKAFELAGAYQFLLNPQVLRQDYHDLNTKMMTYIAGILKDEFMKNKDYFFAALDQAQAGKKLTAFHKEGDKICDYDSLSDKARTKIKPTFSFDGDNVVDWSWAPKLCDFIIAEQKRAQND